MTDNNELAITPDTWIISDTHFFHVNIGRYCNRPENWQDLIIKNWNDLISPDEPVPHLVDFAYGVINLHGHIHNTPPPLEGSYLSPNYINMSIEVRDYRPWRLRDIVDIHK